MRQAVNLLAGLLFGLGLLISGMANPAKVQNFLDLTGTFDPSLIFVMFGAVVVTFIGYRLVFRRPKPVLSERFLSSHREVGRRPTGDRRYLVRHRLGPVRVLSWPCHHFSSAVGERYTYICAGDVRWHRLGASFDANEDSSECHLRHREQLLGLAVLGFLGAS